MHAVTAGLIAAGLLLGLAAAVFALITRATADRFDVAWLRGTAGSGQGCTALALVSLARYGYHPPTAALAFVYLAMAVGVFAIAAWLPDPARE